ncbi:unnamed protein product [Miscanthus lutarioriparius]|uniref:Uncharacterized protein n=1 Tax=Miscanthus lutarioriparius TaxID=422564 RepID=A0A811RPM4_9POAL|nr:unnamed protein product [Miscanthus lutarioriparius]
MMNREYLPFTTDVVFGKVGHEVTFSLEEANFEPAIPPPNPDYSDRDEDAAGKDDANHGRDGGQAQKKQKTIENTSSSSNAPTRGGPVPMQLATAMSLLEKKGLGKLSQLLSLDDIAKPVTKLPEKATSGERTSTEPSLEATERSLVAGTHTLPSDQSHSPRLSKKVTPTQPMPTSPRPKVGTNSRSTSPIPMLCEIDSSVRPEIPHSSSSAPTIRQTVKPAKSGDLLMSRLMTPRPSASSKLGKDVATNINDGSGLQSPSADEDMTSKAMRRAAIRNLDSPPEKKSAAAQSVVPHSPSSPSIPQPEVDRTIVTPPTKQSKKGDMNVGVTKPLILDASDDKTVVDDDLLTHLIKDVSEVDFEDMDPDTKLCDLKATIRKSKSTSRKHKIRKRVINKT